MAIKGGYYIKSRCIRESRIAHSAPIDREVWDYLMREANHEGKKYNGFIVKRGQLFRSYRDIRESLHWNVGCCKKFYSESAMKRCMKRLREALMIELVCEPRGNLITVCNYEYYQNPKNYERTDQRTDQRTSGEPVANQERLAINKNDKNVKKEKNKTFCEKNGIPEGFEEFYQAYPKKRNKPDALKAWWQIFLKPDYPKYHGPVDLKKILDSITSHKKTTSWRKEGGQYVPYPASWLRAHGFNDSSAIIGMETEEEENPFAPLE